MIEEELFFERLRRHAKWVFVLMALVFGLGFVLFGVGSGSNGISDILRNNLNFGTSSGVPSLGKLEATTRKNPRDAKAFRALATAYEQNQRPDDAIATLERYTALRPKDTSAVEELAGLYSQKAAGLQQETRAAQIQAQLATPASTFAPPPTSPFGKAFADPQFANQIDQAVSTEANRKASDAYTKLIEVNRKSIATYRKLAAATPADPTLQIQLGSAAQQGGDTKTAIAAYKKFLELAPTDPLAPAVKQQLKRLTAPSPSPIQAR